MHPVLITVTNITLNVQLLGLGPSKEPIVGEETADLEAR